jgi:two-component system LytT family sensor kinase
MKDYGHLFRQRQGFFTWAFFMLVPWLIPLTGWLFWGKSYFATGENFTQGTLIIAVLVLVGCLIPRVLAQRVIRLYPEPRQSMRRVGLMAAGFVASGVTFAWLVLRVFHTFHLLGFSYQPRTALWVLVTMTGVNIVAAGLIEIAYAFWQWKTTEMERQQLDQQRLMSQLDHVKQQVNPHFLFNSLNSLSVLIGEDTTRAEQFVDEMATVYRYLLQSGPRQGWTTLEAELQFTKAYFYLIHTRYGKGVELSITVPADRYLLFLPHLTLQILIDNALKHNVVSVARPLRIEIGMADEVTLRIRNNLQRKSSALDPDGNRLDSLCDRYFLMGKGIVRISVDPDHYSVEIPLLRDIS